MLRKTIFFNRTYLENDDTIRNVRPGFDPDTVWMDTASSGALLWNFRVDIVTSVIGGNVANSMGLPLGSTSMLPSPDNRSVLMAFTDNVVRLLDLNTGATIQTFDGHADWVTSLNFSPDGRIFASGALDGEVIVWGIYSGEPLAQFEPHSRDIVLVAISGDNQTLMTVSSDGIVHLSDLKTGELLRRMSLNMPLEDAIVDADLRYLTTALRDGSVVRWEIESDAEFLDWVETTHNPRPLSCEERIQYGVEPLCSDETIPARTPFPSLTPTPPPTHTPTVTPTPSPTETPTPTPTHTTTPSGLTT